MAGQKPGYTNFQTKESLSFFMACKLTDVAYVKYISMKGPERYLIVGMFPNLREA